jgi:methylated-DNA-[protein]-cysteine S-methyltransferase
LKNGKFHPLALMADCQFFHCIKGGPMGQRAEFEALPSHIGEHQSVSMFTQQLSVFVTDLGWFGLVGAEQFIVGLTIGHVSADAVRVSLRRKHLFHNAADAADADWFPELRIRLEQYARGAKLDFARCRVSLPTATPFQQRVLNATRKIGYGHTLSYAQLAAKAGSPGAARAVGNVMSSNHAPIIIPCHRVVASGGKLGGYSALQGVSLKQRILRIESAPQDHESHVIPTLLPQLQPTACLGVSLRRTGPFAPRPHRREGGVDGLPLQQAEHPRRPIRVVVPPFRLQIVVCG